MSDIKPPDAGNTSVRFGKAFLRPAQERGHYELMRPIVTVKNEGDRVVTEQHTDPIGPLAVYRIKRRGDVAPTVSGMVAGGPPPEMKTSDPKTGQPMDLILVWWPGKG